MGKLQVGHSKMAVVTLCGADSRAYSGERPTHKTDITFK